VTLTAEARMKTAKRRHGRSRRTAAVLCLLLLAAPGRAGAVISLFQYGAVLREGYSQDVFREGAGSFDDYVTSARLDGQWALRTQRSATALRYIPEYYAYNQFTDLNHLDHRLQSNWQFTPTRRSTVGVRENFVYSTRQIGFSELVDEQGVPIVPHGRRTMLDLVPFWDFDPTAAWKIETAVTLRSHQFRSEELVDSQQAGIGVTASTQIGGGQRLGGRFHHDRFWFEESRLVLVEPTVPLTASAVMVVIPSDEEGDEDEPPPSEKKPPFLPPPPPPPAPEPDPVADPTFTPIAREGGDQFTSFEMLWSREGMGLFNWNAALGFFRGTQDGRPTGAAPTFSFDLGWVLRQGQMKAGYESGYADTGGLGGISRSRTAELVYLRRWGRPWQLYARGFYLSRGAIAGTIFGDTLRGYSADVELSYHWMNGLGLVFNHSAVTQDRGGDSIRFQEAAVSLSFTRKYDRDAVRDIFAPPTAAPPPPAPPSPPPAIPPPSTTAPQ
jgi:hypothetical protein